MPGGFAPRFAVEAGFLILLGVGAGYANLRTPVIIALVGGGWLIVAMIELMVWRSQSRPVAAYVPQPAPAEEEPAPVIDEEPPVVLDDTEYPLRAGAGDAPSEEVEAYTRILGGNAEDDPPSEAAE